MTYTSSAPWSGTTCLCSCSMSCFASGRKLPRRAPARQVQEGSTDSISASGGGGMYGSGRGGVPPGIARVDAQETHPRLQSLISAAMHVHVKSLSDPDSRQRHAVKRLAIDQRNDITRLGIAPKRLARDGSGAKRYRAVEATTGVSSSTKDAGCRSSSVPSEKKRRQDRKTTADCVLRRLPTASCVVCRKRLPI